METASTTLNPEPLILTPESLFTRQKDLCDETVAMSDLRPKQLRLALIAVGGFALYGFQMGASASFAQMISSAIKVPLLFFLTLAITLPALHFVGLHVGSRIRFNQTLIVMFTGLATTAILAASLAPIALFFQLSGSNYSFMLLMHSGFMAFSAIAGLSTVARSMHYLSKRAQEDGKSSFVQGSDICLPIWMLLYGFVGTQLAWTLKPFVGSADGPFIAWNPEQGNFYTAIIDSVWRTVAP